MWELIRKLRFSEQSALEYIPVRELSHKLRFQKGLPSSYSALSFPVGTHTKTSRWKADPVELLDSVPHSGFLVDMNQKTAKLLSKYAALKAGDSEQRKLLEKQFKREWLVLNEHQKDRKRQEILKELVK
ncbi:hypothetical protein CH379_011210 [Leptospira ellisii]|uniref:Uncharacterized protein n=1 Tax=Leptospira ellisii TaxID=2023197 RepID=A0A2N0B305_9LEPT|nr:hypothetical protein [Leptospira ellisii]MDV6236191.1 hypothetical protein [Leptospira ellisii]PJZ90905.1 hypothetical protein CH379_21675 [Leptospira ellisii]PKA02949.1 hypothetical protein CH375_19935 [Leptospira ellisii]